MARDPFVVKKAYSNPLSPSPLDSSNNSLIGVRVKSIILDDSTSEGWAALGAIEYQDVTTNKANTSKAYPLNSNSRCFPLINEIVYIISLPGSNMNNSNTKKKIYYINNIGIWNHPHHNAFPSDPNNLTEIQRDDYVFKGQDTNTTEDDITIRQTSGSTGIYLGKTFVERSNIHPLLPFEGDFIQEGRWGNSLRFGSTVQETIQNDWSMYGTNGDPITILRNGQGNQTEEGWIPIVENINNDNSSIYLTSTQQVPLKTTGRLDRYKNTDYSSYENSGILKPTSPTQYAGNQIILNAGRLVFNAKEDHILLTSPLSINLNSKETINIDTTKFIVQSNKIFLGNENQAVEPLMLGNKTVDWLIMLIETIEKLNNTLTTLTSLPVAPFTPAVFPELYTSALNAQPIILSLKQSLNDDILISKNNFTL